MRARQGAGQCAPAIAALATDHGPVFIFWLAAHAVELDTVVRDSRIALLFHRSVSHVLILSLLFHPLISCHSLLLHACPLRRRVLHLRCAANTVLGGPRWNISR